MAVTSLTRCEKETNTDVAPEIFIGEKTDTAFLNTSYVAAPVEMLGYGECVPVEITGRVNTAVVGTYYLDYDYTDTKGNKSATVTRTVHVVENRAALLNGNYNAVCTCTAVSADITKGASKPTITTSNYTAAVSSYTLNDHFNLVPLKIGSEYVVPFATLHGNSISAGFYHRNFVVGDNSSGTLSPEKNTFTIETTNYQMSPPIKYHCKNVFTKQVTEIAKK